MRLTSFSARRYCSPRVTLHCIHCQIQSVPDYIQQTRWGWGGGGGGWEGEWWRGVVKRVRGGGVGYPRSCPMTSCRWRLLSTALTAIRSLKSSRCAARLLRRVRRRVGLNGEHSRQLQCTAWCHALWIDAHSPLDAFSYPLGV